MWPLIVTSRVAAADHRGRISDWVATTFVVDTVLVGVPKPEDGIEAARRLVGEGVQLIELCGGFGPVWAGRIIEAIDGAVPVGIVGYGPEAVDQVHAIFS